MTYCISYHVSQRLGDGVENPFVQICILPSHHQFDVSAALPRHIARHAREATEQLLNWNHADFHHRALQVVEDPCLKSDSIGEPAPQLFLGITIRQFA